MTEDARLTTYWIAGILLAAIAVNMIALATKAHAETGVASIYGNNDGYAWKKTANGETMNPRAMTAAHKWLPFGTRAQVHNRRTGKTIVVRITDRGPFIRGRIIDLTPAAARALACDGLCAVTVTP